MKRLVIFTCLTGLLAFTSFYALLKNRVENTRNLEEIEKLSRTIPEIASDAWILQHVEYFTDRDTGCEYLYVGAGEGRGIAARSDVSGSHRGCGNISK